MPPGRPKKLSPYEQGKANKIRAILLESGIRQFNRINDAALLKTLYVDSSGKVFVSHDYHTATMNEIAKKVAEFTGR